MSLWDNVAGALPQGGRTSGFWGPLRPAVQAAVAPQPSMGTIGQPGGSSGGITYGSGPGQATLNPGPQNVPQGPSGVTRRGSQMVDAQGNVIGHYGNNDEPIYNAGQGPQGPKFPGQQFPPLPPWADDPRGGTFPMPGDPNRTPQLPPWMHGPLTPPGNGGINPGPYGPILRDPAWPPQASTSMGMDPRYQRMQLPGGQVQDVPSAYAPNYLQQGGSLTGESTQYPAYNLSNVGRSGYR